MKLCCPSCRASFYIKDFTAFSRKSNYVKCSRCYHIWDATQKIVEQMVEEKEVIKEPNKTIIEKQKSVSEKNNTHIRGKPHFLWKHLNVLLFIVGITICSILIFIQYHHQSSFTKNIIVQNSEYSVDNDKVHLKYSLLNLSNETIVLNKVQIIFWKYNNNIAQIVTIPSSTFLHPLETESISNKITCNIDLIKDIKKITLKFN